MVTYRVEDNPNIHPEKNGSSAGWLTTVKGILSLDAMTYVPGHGELLTRDQIQKRLAATTARRDKIVVMVKQGKSVEDIKAAFPDNPSAATQFGFRPAPRRPLRPSQLQSKETDRQRTSKWSTKRSPRNRQIGAEVGPPPLLRHTV